MEPQALTCIYLKPIDNLQGGHKLLNLATNKIITWQSYTEVPLTDTAMACVHELADKDKISSAFSFLDRKGNPIPDYDPTLAGVPLDDNNNDPNY